MMEIKAWGVEIENMGWFRKKMGRMERDRGKKREVVGNSFGLRWWL